MKNQPDRRKHNRFVVREGAFAVMAPGFKNMGQIKNISKGGLAYRYVANEATVDDLLKLDIFLSNKDFYFNNIPFKTVSILDEISEFPYSSISMKQCCIQFGQLDRDQKHMLDYFILNHTIKSRPQDRRQANASHYKGPERRKSV